jgi:hypothetical protein
MGRARRRAGPPLAAAAIEPGAPAKEPVRAVLVVHGIGQQVRFQTLDEIAQGLLREAGSTRPPAARSVRIGDDTFQRLELFLPLPGGGEREVHVYEAYWAPITEGQVSLRDVTSFLFGAGFNGLRNLGGALRYSFGRARTIRPSAGGTVALGSAFGVLLTLVAMNAVLLALAVLSGLEPGFVPDTLKARLAQGAPALLAILTAFGLATLALLLAVALADWMKRRTARARLDGLWRAVGAALQLLFLLWLGLTLLSGLAVVVLVSGVGPAIWLRGELFCPWLKTYWLLPLLVLLAASAAVRRLFVEYVGDIAAYVTSYRLDRFAEVRGRIKALVWKAAAALYEATEDAASAAWAYDGVAVVAHSLGSVIAYDALNALLVEDAVSPEKRGVAARTRLFLTFGSPLEKTAFLFATQSSRTTDTREALVAALQPLISDYAFRPFRWVNVFSSRDPVSGRLESYDDPDDPLFRRRRIRNLPDRSAVLPLIAHLEYFGGAVVHRQLRRALL